MSAATLLELPVGEWSTEELAPNPRPRCRSCGSFAPTIDGHCVAHMTQRTEIALYTVSAEDVLAEATHNTQESK